MLIHAVHHPGLEGPLPTVVALHGFGAHGQDLLGLAPALLGGNVLLLCPQAPLQIEHNYPGYSWYPFTEGGNAPAEDVQLAVEQARAFVDEACARYPVDPQRLVLLGFSQGGMIAYRLAFSEPARYRGLAALSSALTPEAIEGVSPSDALRALPVLVQHGERDPVIPVDRARRSIELLASLGIEPEYHEYPMQHEVSAQSARDLSAWLGRVLGVA